ncbi:hypothetical protein [Streptomyces sp. NBC_00316]|uniref:hypothetical protein n=1 Tax=Streptomyces sp. NBC_00316 TaxID=2975710 RepID=UPI003FA7C6C1
MAHSGKPLVRRGPTGARRTTERAAADSRPGNSHVTGDNVSPTCTQTWRTPDKRGAAVVHATREREGRDDAVRVFWIAYLLTRPLGASMGDALCQLTGDSGSVPAPW